MSRQEVRHNLCLRMSVQHVIKSILSLWPFTLLGIPTECACCCFWYQKMPYGLCCVLVLKDRGRENQSRQMKVLLHLFSLSLSLKINPEIYFVSTVSKLSKSDANRLLLDYWIRVVRMQVSCH